jgi:hypothetical protein
MFLQFFVSHAGELRISILIKKRATARTTNTPNVSLVVINLSLQAMMLLCEQSLKSTKHILFIPQWSCLMFNT